MNLRCNAAFVVVLILFSWLFSGATDAQTAKWVNPNGGSWTIPENWDSGESPGTGEPVDVVIDLETGGPYEVLANAAGSIGNLTIDSADAIINFVGRSLRVENTIDLVQGTFNFDNETSIDAGEIKLNGNQPFFESLATFERALIRGDFNTIRTQISLQQGASTTGRIDLRNNSTLQTQGDLAIGDTTTLDDTFILLSNSKVLATENSQLTLGANSKITGLGRVGAEDSATFINQGSLFASVQGKALVLTSGTPGVPPTDDGAMFVNKGIIRARNGGILVIERPIRRERSGLFVNEVGGQIILEGGSEGFIGQDWISRGRIDIRNGASLVIDADFTTSDLQSIVPRVNSEVIVRRVEWDNRGQSMNFDRRSEHFLFDRTTINGGVIFARNAPLRLDGRVTFNDLRYVGDILVDGNFHILNANNSQLVGRAKLVGISPTLNFQNSDLSEATQIELVGTAATLKIENENSTLRWNGSQTISGAGEVQINGEGQSLRNFGTIEANLSGRRLSLMVADGINDFVSNRGLIQAQGGGLLRIEADNGLIYNHQEGVIRSGEGSMVEVFAERFVNHGTIELLENSSLILESNYTNSLLESITHETDSASIFLDGLLKLEDDEVFMPSERYVIGDRSRFDGGTIDFSRSNQLGTTAGMFANLTIDGDVRVTHSNSVEFSGVTATSGNIQIDAGSLRLLEESVVAGMIDVDGPDSVLKAHSDFTTAGTEIVLHNGAQMEIGFGQGFTLSEGASISGNGFLSLEVPQSSIRFTNQGTIDASGPDSQLSLAREWADRDEFINNGVMTIRDGGVVNTGKYTRQFEADAKVLLDDGTWSISGSLLVTNGEISGNGLIEADNHFFYGGKISPGISTGHLQLTGDVSAGPPVSIFENMASGEVEMLFDIGGAGRGEIDGYDFLSIDGDLNFGIGELFSLHVNTLGETAIEDLSGREFSIIEITEGSEIQGTLKNVLSGGYLTTLDNRFDFQVFYGADNSFGSNQVTLTNFSLASVNFSLTAVPEPNVVLLIAFASTILATRRRKA